VIGAKPVQVHDAEPGRYEQHLAVGRPLPRETRQYVAKIAPAIGCALAQALAPTRERAVQELRVATAAPIAVRWRQTPLFAGKLGCTNAALARVPAHTGKMYRALG
jgi:hypothetical protein